jgi:hypothetical protein
MAHAKDRKFTELYVDRDTSSWTEPLLVRKAAFAGSNDFGSTSWSADSSGLVCPLPNQALGAQVIAETWYIAPSGVTVGKVMYVGTDSNLPAGYEAPKLYANSATNGLGSSGDVAATFDSTLRTATPTIATRYVYWRHYANGTAATPAVGSNRRISAVGVYGNHGLTSRAIDSSTPDGFYASDVIKNIVSRFCPKLNTAGVQDTTYVIPHLVFRERTFPYDAFLEVNKYHLWELAVWENKTVHFGPTDMSDYDWEVRTDDPGTSFEWQGDSTEDHFNGIVVQFTNTSTGRQETLTPDDTPALADTSVENPATTHGIDRWDEIQLSTPTTAAAAAEIGRIALAERNQPKAPGSIRIQGHIKDRAGHWQQAWKVRAGDTISITNHPNDRPRLVTETSWDHDSRTLTVAVDSSMMRLDAILDRVQTALTAANLS